MARALMIGLDAAKVNAILLQGEDDIHLSRHPKFNELPFKVYIYELKKSSDVEIFPNLKYNVGIQSDGQPEGVVSAKLHYKVRGTGKVVGEFICDRIIYNPDRSCELHVSNRVLYEDSIPKYAFCKPCGRQAGCYCDECKMWNGNKPITRTPSPFLYVESLQEVVDV